MSKTPYLIEQTPVAPDVTGSGVLLVVESLGRCPLDGNSVTIVSDVVIFFGQIAGHAKICNLTNSVLVDKDIPCSEISVNVSSSGKVLHTQGYLLRKFQK